MTRIPTAVAAAALLVLAALAPLAAAKPSVSEQSDRIVLSNEHLRVTLQGKKPLLHVSDATNDSRSYQVFLMRLVEVPPNAQPGEGSELASFDLVEARDWNVTQAQASDGSVTLTMRADGPLKVRGSHAGGPLPVPVPEPVQNATGNVTGNGSATVSAGNASVGIVFHLFAQPTTVQDGSASIAVGTSEVKFDLLVDRWTWVNRNDQLALEFQLTPPDNGGSKDNSSGGNATATAPNATTAPPANAGSDAGQVPVEQNGTRLGWLGWAPYAQATTNGTTVNVNVERLVQGHGKGDAQTGSSGPLQWLRYEASGFDKLVHDPSVGIVPSGSNAQAAGGNLVPGFDLSLLAIGAPAAAGAMLVARRRR